MSEKNPFRGEKFLKRKYGQNKEFEKTIKKRAERKQIADKEYEEQISSFLEKLENFLKDERAKELLLNQILYPKYIIKPEDITDKYIKNILLENFAESRGYQREQLKDPAIKRIVIELFEKETKRKFENYSIPDYRKKEIVKEIIENQKLSLKIWLDYLTSPEAQHYDPAFRYWVFGELLKLGIYQPETKSFTIRTKKTTAPFPELNPQALSMVLDLIIKKNLEKNKEELIDIMNWLDQTKKDELKNILELEDFGKLYGWCLDYVKSLKTPKERLSIIVGEWKLFKNKSDPKELVKAIQNYNTGWCIANEAMAVSYLKNFDLLIYFSQDEKGKNTIPRAAIVINSKTGEITEVRGIGENQNLDPYITPIVEQKLKEIPSGQEWLETTNDMKKLTEIYFKVLRNEELTKEELKFIYQIDRPIKSFGFTPDPRIEEIIKRRNVVEDLNKIFEGIKRYEGNINLHYLESAEGLLLPEEVNGYVNLNNLVSIEKVKLPRKITGDLLLRRLKSVTGVKFPEEVGGNLDLTGLKEIKRSNLPQKVGGNLYLCSLISAKELKLPQEIGGSIDLSSLKSAKGLKLPKKINGDLFLSGLESAEGLELPREIKGGLYLSGLKSAKGLKLPEKIEGNLDLSGLKSAKGLKLPKEINGDIFLSGLESAEGLELPREIKGGLYLSGLKSAKGLKLPEKIGKNLDLSGLTLAKGLILPREVSGDLSLGSLEFAEGVKFPEKVGGNLYLSSLKSAKGVELPKEIGKNLYLLDLESTEGLELPENIGGYIYFDAIFDREGGIEEIEKLKEKYYPRVLKIKRWPEK